MLAVLRKRHAMWANGLRKAVDRTDGVRPKLLAIYDYLGEWFAEEIFRGCGFINAFAELGPTSRRWPRTSGRSRSFWPSWSPTAGADPAFVPQLAILAEGAQTSAAIEGYPEPPVMPRRGAELLIDASSRRGVSAETPRTGRPASPRPVGNG